MAVAVVRLSMCISAYSSTLHHTQQPDASTRLYGINLDAARVWLNRYRASGILSRSRERDFRKDFLAQSPYSTYMYPEGPDTLFKMALMHALVCAAFVLAALLLASDAARVSESVEVLQQDVWGPDALPRASTKVRERSVL